MKKFSKNAIYGICAARGTERTAVRRPCGSVPAGRPRDERRRAGGEDMTAIFHERAKDTKSVQKICQKE